ncbi:NifB/NifX family molybdenum-iron cluster-binding protein [Thermodesulfobacteriota bacterium]
MKFAIPFAEGKLAVHFGHSQAFALVEVEENQIKNTEYLVPPPHEPGVLPKWLSDLGTNIVLAGGMGHRAIGLFDEYGIKVITGAQELEPEELVTSYLENRLVVGENVCDH